MKEIILALIDKIDTNIIGAAIEAAGVILAAVIGLNLFEKKVKRYANNFFTTYASTSIDIGHLIWRAKESLVVVAVLGDNFVGTRAEQLESALKNGIRVDYLINDYPRAMEYARMRGYHPGVMEGKIYGAFDILERLNQYENFHIREVDLPLNASYIGIDIHPENGRWHPGAVIQMMTYQYRVKAKDTPLTYLSPVNNEPYFKTTAGSIDALWDRGTPLDFGAYRRLLTVCHREQ